MHSLTCIRSRAETAHRRCTAFPRVACIVPGWLGEGEKGRVFPAVGRADLPGERFRGVAFPGLHPPETGRLVPEPWAEAYFTAHLDKLNTSLSLSLNSPPP